MSPSHPAFELHWTDRPTEFVTVGELKKAFLDMLTTAAAATTKDLSLNWDDGWGGSFSLLYEIGSGNPDEGQLERLDDDETPRDYCIQLEEVGSAATFLVSGFSHGRTTEAFQESLKAAVLVKEEEQAGVRTVDEY